LKQFSQLDIRGATADDLPKIVEQMAHTGSNPLYPFTDLGRLQNIPLDGLIVAEFQSEYAGFLYWFVEENPEFDRSVTSCEYIQKLQVLEKFQRHGIGRKLVTYALKQLKESGIEAVYLDTREGNTSAQNLYESLGFRQYSRRIRYKLSTS